MIAGTVVNVQRSDDYILRFLYLTSMFQFGVAGLQPVQGVARMSPPKKVEGIKKVDITGLMGERATQLTKPSSDAFDKILS